MGAVRFISDLHLGHRNIIKYRANFQNVRHHDLFLMSILEEISNKRDKLFVLGDAFFKDEFYSRFKELPGTKHLLLGNHCVEYNSIGDLLKVFDEISGIIKYKEFFLSHAPIHPDELRGKFNIHGHVHDASINDARYLNVCVDSSFTNYVPRSLEQVREAFASGKIYLGNTVTAAMTVINEDKMLNRLYNKALKESTQTTVYTG